jgi:GNAT superfamily N-acetyltransferase
MTAPGVTRFRAARTSDLKLVLPLMAEYYAEDGYPFDESAARAAATMLLATPSLGCLWVAEIDEEVAGYMAVTFGFSLEYRGRDAFLDEIYIAERFRGRGLGREAMNLAESFCRQSGVRALHLEVERHRNEARELYRSRGFESRSRELMTKRLD